MTLRALEPEDIDLLYQTENDESMWVSGSANVPFSRYALTNYIATCTNDIYQDGQLRLVAERDGAPVAIVDLVDFNAQHQRAEVGIVVLPEQRKKGVGKEVLLSLEEFIRKHCPIHQLYAYVIADNTASLTLFHNVGYKYVSVLHDWLRQEESYMDVYLLQKLI